MSVEVEDGIIEDKKVNNNEERKALLSRRNHFGMDEGRQFSLLFQKNLILAKRSKLWVLCELILPILFTLPIILIVLKFANIEPIPAESYLPVGVTGNTDDLTRKVGFVNRMVERWRPVLPDDVKIAYSSDMSIKNLDLIKIITSLENRYKGGHVRFVKFDNRTSMMNALKLDITNITNFAVYIGKYAGGIDITELDLNERKFSYDIHLPNLPKIKGDVFETSTYWNDVYGPQTEHNKIPATPPLWSSGFLSFQYALDSIFINETGGSREPIVLLHRLPEAGYKVNSVGIFFHYLPGLWGFCAFLTVLHAGREVAHEKVTVKSFLSVMGLSTPMFYLSHIIFSWIKCMLIFLICAIPLTTVMSNVSISLFLFTVFLYGLGTVIFGVLIASIFKTPNSVIKAIIIIWLVLVALPYVKTIRTEQITLCFLSSININAAFYFAVAAIGDNMYTEHQLGWLTMFANSSFSFTIGYAVLMMIFDIFWMSTLILIFDKILCSADFSLRGIFAKEGIEEADACNKTGVYQKDEYLSRQKPQLEVSNLVKIWSETGERAVNQFSLRAYSGMVTVLLGHNGAGKSTTFAILCGLIKPTSGRVEICGEHVSVGKTHKKVGYCPQGNALFDKLTVDEHLWLIHGLKGGKNSWSDEAGILKDSVGLTDHRWKLSMHLSGGMKRKLCVCLSLIGDSQVILLDEPTAGMDPGARKDVERLLYEQKKEKTILLTTHYMDEAELLGDRIAIMSKGHLECIGSPEFLKTQYGTGYILTVVVEDDYRAEDLADKIVTFSRQIIEKAKKGTAHGRQLEVVLPKEDQQYFPELFSRLEKEQKRLNIISFGLSLNTLEQVFLTVGERAENGRQLSTENSDDYNQQLIDSQGHAKNTSFSLFFAQLHAIFMKRLIYSKRNWPQLFTQVLIPLLILVFIAWLSHFTVNDGGNDYSKQFNRETFGPSRVIVQTYRNSTLFQTYKQLIDSWPSSVMIELSKDDDLIDKVNNLPKTMPPTGLGAVFAENNIEVLFNSRAPSAIATSMNLLSNARLRLNGQGYINTGIYAYSQPASSAIVFTSSVIDNILGPLLMLALALVTSTFVMFYVEERNSKFRHQQSLTGVSPLVFWGGSLLYDFIFYILVCAGFLVFFLVKGWLSSVLGFVVFFWFLYFWAVMPFIYTVSFIFSSPSKANVLLVIWQIVAAVAALIILLAVRFQATMGNISPIMSETIRFILLMFLPSFALGNALMTLGQAAIIPSDKSYLWEWDELGKNIACMVIFGFMSAIIFIAFQFKFVRRAFSKIWDIRSIRDDAVQEEDADVREEKLNVLQGNDHYLLEVHDMSKNFGRLKAVDHLSMGIKQGECFGLLGVNGAGKTTTFDILTGQSFPTRGYAKIDNHDVTEHIAIGYCPQFDAMMMDFTGKETLTMIARMYGFKDPVNKAKLVLQAVGMNDHGDKLVRYYSGGQRRKISVGLALLAATKIVILDEPTAGIDPKARRDVWNVLTAVRNNTKSASALLLTSHSMDECEALCTKIAVLKRGRMIAIGEAQHLKSKFGKSFALTLVVPKPEMVDEVIHCIQKKYPDAILKTAQSLTLKWQLNRLPGDKWSTKFSECQKLADLLKIEDFCLTQSSLEETFLRISNNDEESV